MGPRTLQGFQRLMRPLRVIKGPLEPNRGLLRLLIKPLRGLYKASKDLIRPCKALQHLVEAKAPIRQHKVRSVFLKGFWGKVHIGHRETNPEK